MAKIGSAAKWCESKRLTLWADPLGRLITLVACKNMGPRHAILGAGSAGKWVRYHSGSLSRS